MVLDLFDLDLLEDLDFVVCCELLLRDFVMDSIRALVSGTIIIIVALVLAVAEPSRWVLVDFERGVVVRVLWCLW